MRRKFLICIIWGLIAANIYSQEWTHEMTEYWEPEPAKVIPGTGTNPPSDAIILFDGTSLDEWIDDDGETPKWKVEDGTVTVVPKTGSMTTRRAFGDCQLHVEFSCPPEDTGTSQQKGNSGVVMQGRYEIQVLDNYENKTYVNGQCASVYKQYPPLVNACKPPGEWQTYDIIYTAPRFRENGILFTPGYVTIIHNGVLVQNHVEIRGRVKYIGLPEYQPHNLKEPLMLHNHTDSVKFRNIWIREL